MKQNDLLRALWLAAKANGGTLRIGPSTVQEYPGDKVAIVTVIDRNFCELVIVSSTKEDAS